MCRKGLERQHFLWICCFSAKKKGYNVSSYKDLKEDIKGKLLAVSFLLVFVDDLKALNIVFFFSNKKNLWKI
jgi:hypothetical protein